MKALVAGAMSALLAFSAIPSAAAPAPWFKWRSTADGKQVCSQTPLGSGWKKASGPYRDSHCEKIIIAK
jgi:hypothetical protein